MTIHLLCLTSTGGLPIFSRKKGECESLPFSTIGSLNGVHMFCKSQGVKLKTTYMEDGLVVWREFDDCITLIGAAKGLTERVMNDLLELVYSAMIVCISANELKHNKNVEQLKRELKILHFYPMLDRLLEYADNELLKFTDCILSNEGLQILAKLNEFSELVGSPFCCVMARHKVLAGTEGWWALDAVDRKLLIALLSSTNLVHPDFPVFLPKKSPNIAYRFVSVQLCSNVTICVLCGAEPSYSDLENLAQQVWKNDLNVLEAAEICYPRNFPINCHLGQGILGIILINKTHSKYIMSRNPQQSTSGKRTSSGAHRLDILRTFFHQAVDVIDDFLLKDLKKSTENTTKSIKSLESYWCSDYHKCHAFIQNDNLICVLYVAAIPTHTMRLITQKTINLIISEKDISW